MNQKELKYSIILTLSLTTILILVSYISKEIINLYSLPLFFFVSSTFLIFTGAVVYLFIDSLKWEQENKIISEGDTYKRFLVSELQTLRNRFNEVIEEIRDEQRFLRKKAEDLEAQMKEFKKITEINGQNQVHQFFEV